MEQTKILQCTCKHEYQDKAYGKNHRLHNFANKKNMYRCTVCGKEKPANS